MVQPVQEIEEKRQYQRFPVSFMVAYTVRSPFQVRISIGDNDCFAIARDIGEGGMGLLTNFKIPVDSLLLLKFTIINDAILSTEDRARSFELDAQVRNCGMTEEASYRLGVSFMNIVPSERAYISDYIQIHASNRNFNA
ncbi:MAG: PilZ domain-containing protein [Candidatus Omnitrophica bacterium]|nr:PilZ domain-containing protein [Candidatus Omnitrophota bacterium]